MKNEEKQKTMIRLQMVANQLKQVEEQQSVLQEKIAELVKLNKALEELKVTKKDAKMHSQLGAGIYAESKLASTDDVIIAVGANVLIKSSVSDAQKTVGIQFEQTQKYAEQIAQGIQMLTMQAVALQKQLEE